MTKRLLVGSALSALVLTLAADTANAQFRGGRGGRGGTFVDTPFGSYGSGRGGEFVSTPFGSYGTGRYGGYGYGGGYGGYGYGGYGRGFGSPYGYGSGGYGRGYGGYGYGSQSYGSGYSPSYGMYSSPGVIYSSPGHYRSPSVSVSPSYALDGSVAPQQSFYSGPEPQRNQALIRVIVPNANAQVFFEGTATQQRGTSRVFTSPTLEEGKTYSYVVKATWTENGKEMTREKEVDVRAGQEAQVRFDADSGERGVGELDIERRDAGRSEKTEASANSHGGTVVRISSNEFVMKSEGGEEHSHRLAPDAQIRIDGQDAKLEDLKAGMHIEVTTREGDKKIATRIEAHKSKGADKAPPPPQ